MKKKIILILTILVILLLGIYIGMNIKPSSSNIKDKPNKTKSEIKEKNNLVSYNGYLKIQNNTLVNEHGEKIMLKGLSSHGIQWFKDLITKENIQYTKDNWNANLFRIAMYTKENGYIDNKEIKQDVYNIIDMVIDLDMYVIVDWHILSDNDPLMYKEEAKDFFNELSKKYKDYPNIIYEICNEPNGNVTWENNIKPYAEEIISVIRKNTQKSIIIVGTPTWSQDVDKPANDPIDDSNVMYALHFYSGTHTEYLRQKAKEALNKIPIFVSEWGVSDASGNGGVYIEEARKWIDFMKENNLSWANWSLANKDESSALLKPNTYSLDDDNLSESGKFIKEVMKN